MLVIQPPEITFLTASLFALARTTHKVSTRSVGSYTNREAWPNMATSQELLAQIAGAKQTLEETRS